MMRRDPKAILAAHKMDPMRRELYVEGEEDRALIRWTVGDAINPNARVLTVDAVALSGFMEGGHRARLIAFARIVEGDEAKIKFLADADNDRLFGRTVPSNVWLTDSRDLEGYVFRKNCVEKLLKLGLVEEGIEAESLLANILSVGRMLGLLRLISEEEGLNLPFQRTDPWRSLSFSRSRGLSCDLTRYVSTLLQNAGRSLKEVQTIIERIPAKDALLASIPDYELLHGKDAICLLEKVLIDYGVARGEAIRILRSAFERSFAQDYPSLNAAITFLAE